eukprot:TRINITY_DN28808_c0_g1_i1.p1 TRINITY_DN28808_c0_g1~~TRINITY_DN28808_c0_g1_i1.p1  ORF type:complete len:1183 (-),score=229.97 TRINITY_DN28808_c0_g1_i1:60-3422(-)
MAGYDQVDAIGAIIGDLFGEFGDLRARLQAGGGVGSAAAENEGGVEALLSALNNAEASLRSRADQLTSTAQIATAKSLAQDAKAWQEEKLDKRVLRASRSLSSESRGFAKGLPRPKPPPRQRIDSSPLLGLADAPTPSVPLGRPLQAPTYGTRIREKPTLARRLLPRQNRLDPLAEPPPLTEYDLEAGLLDLGSRGFIPRTVDLTPAMERGRPVALRKQARLFDPALAQRKGPRADLSAMGSELAAVKLDVGEGLQHFYSAPQSRLQRSLGALSNPQASSSSSSLLPLQQSSALALPAPEPAQDSSGFFFTELQDGGVSGEPAREVRRSSLGQANPQNARKRRNSAAYMSMTHIKNEASTKICARARGMQQRKKYRYLLKAKRSASCLQHAWTVRMVPHLIARRLLSKRQQEDILTHATLMRELGQAWSVAKTSRRVEVHICSVTIAEHRRAGMQGFQALQEAQAGRIFRLLDANRDVVLVAPAPLHEDILDYYAQLMKLRGIDNPSGRFQIVVPEQMGLSANLSLTQALLCSPKALQRVRKLVSGRRAVIIPGMPSLAELRLCSELGLPLFGTSPENMHIISSKSSAKQLCKNADLPIGPWAADIRSEDEFYKSLASLVVQHPDVRIWLAKIDDEHNSRGHLRIDMQRMRRVVKLARSSRRMAVNPSSDDRDEAARGSDASEQERITLEVEELLRRHVPQRAVACNPRAYGEFVAWITEAASSGAVIQAVPNNITAQASVHVQVDPDAAVRVLGSSEPVMCAPFVSAASWYPHTRGSWEVLCNAGVRAGRALASSGYVGFASIDVVFYSGTYCARVKNSADLATQAQDSCTDAEGEQYASENEEVLAQTQSTALGRIESSDGHGDASGWWVVDVDPRLTDAAAALWPLQFVAEVRPDPTTGRLLPLATEEEAAANGSGGDGRAAAASRERAASAEHSPKDEGAPPRPASSSAASSSAPPGSPAPRTPAPSRERWALFNHVAHVPGLGELSCQELFRTAAERGVVFDVMNNIGCVFEFLNMEHSMFSLMSVDTTPEACAVRLAKAVCLIAESPGITEGGPRGRAGPPAASEDADGLRATDVQRAMRNELRRWSNRPRSPSPPRPGGSGGGQQGRVRALKC